MFVHLEDKRNRIHVTARVGHYIETISGLREISNENLRITMAYES